MLINIFLIGLVYATNIYFLNKKHGFIVKPYKPDITDKLIIYFFSLVITFIVFLLSFGIYTMLIAEHEETKIHVRIKSLKENKFHIGLKEEESTNYYIYYYKHIDGGWALGKTPTNDCRIEEWNKNYGEKQYKKVFCKKYPNVVVYRTKNTVLKVPKGSILTNYNK